MSYALELSRGYLDSLEWKYQEDQTHNAIRFGMELDNGKVECLLIEKLEQELLQFFSLIPLNVPIDRLHAISEYINRANYGLHYGSFEMDYDTGEVRYRTTAFTSCEMLNQQIVSSLIHVNLNTMDRYLHGAMKVMYGDANPKEIIEEIETQL
ncbi:YbjN domain-containing protein [Limibacter armeniacum]|uniref:YbjN domain-containing protein n=1 Tax=Limibacter armeniacum TaxID=466084 RepID=UPI002FE6871A